ncbi:MAG: sugar phosphate isomerase/epimerase [Chitinophagaceae bacterium]|nr:sugar phosphate isomerase/epimerase [Chitinophagaceae bacterium]
MKQGRRKFIQTTAAGSAALLLSSLESFSLASKPSFTQHEKYELLILATDWGYEGNYDSFFSKIKKDGYNGCETWLPGEEKYRMELTAAAQKHGLVFGIMFGIADADVEKNRREFIAGLDQAIALKPIYINCHTAKDHFSFEQLKPFFEYTIQLSKKTGIPIYHETHRGRALYSAPVAAKFLESIPDLKVTADLSHWCNVHESFLEDQEETMKLVLERTEHIHARIGHAEGPQVNDPRAPEWEYAVKKHFEWWDKVVERKKKNGQRMTFLTEFGPPLYMPTLPYTQQPLANQWEINVHMMKLLRERYT